jgi:hypothetical protein
VDHRVDSHEGGAHGSAVPDVSDYEIDFIVDVLGTLTHGVDLRIEVIESTH